MKKLLCFLSVFFLLIGSTPVFGAAVTKQIYYEKATEDAELFYCPMITSNDPPCSQTHHFRFSLYDAEAAGSQVWSEEADVTLDANVISHALGSITTLAGVDFANKQLWVEVEWQKPDLSWKVIDTRDRFGVVPYALWSESGSGGGSGDITGVTAGTGLTGGGTTGDVTVSLTTPVAISNGGTGSTTKNFVDLTTDQTVGGAKTFSNDVTMSGSLNLPATTATTGIITSNGNRLIHTYGGGGNFFGGLNAGNLTMSGGLNTATGYDALYTNDTGAGNTASGAVALYSNTTGNNNTAIGYFAGYNLTTGSNNIYIGYDVRGSAGDSNTTRIGNGQTQAIIAGTVTATGFVGDGSGLTNVSAASIANTAVTPGSYTKANITVNAQGRLTAASSGGSVNLATEVTGILPVANGGTGSGTPSGARTNLGAAASGANSDITSLSGLTTPLSVAQGGTGSSNYVYSVWLAGPNLADVRNNASVNPTASTWYTIPGRTVAFTKALSTSKLRVTYQDTLGTYGWYYGGCEWQILLDGVQIAFFSNADQDSLAGTNYYRMNNAAHVAWTTTTTAGSHTITIQNRGGRGAWGAGTTECMMGWNTVGSFVSVEELP